MERRSIGILTVLSLVVAVLSVVAPIVWDRYKTKTALELRLLSKATLVAESVGLEELRVLYADRPIKNLTRYDIALINVGRTSIRKEDFIAPIRISFELENELDRYVRKLKSTLDSYANTLNSNDEYLESEILDVRVKSTDPVGIELSPSVSADRKSVLLASTLLNPNDSVELSIAVVGAKLRMSASGRIAGVAELALVDRLPRVRSLIDLDASFYFLAIGTAIVGLATLLGLIRIGTMLQIGVIARSGALMIPNSWSRLDVEKFIDAELWPVRNSLAMKAVRAMLGTIPVTDTLNAEQRRSIQHAMSQATAEAKNQSLLIAVLATLTLFGFGYLVSILLRTLAT